MFVINRRCFCMSRSMTTFVRKFATETKTNNPKSNEDQLTSTINLLTNQVKSMQFEINCKFEALNTQMKVFELGHLRTDICGYS
ncbi:unnamed protein product [Meloidogyne enterolobii]|uniref:Uncharacterized protein n=1 Tax=Meloidogyne enterolobii TaxID=390850 RepID=A0ACB0Z052_MELEN